MENNLEDFDKLVKRAEEKVAYRRKETFEDFLQEKHAEVYTGLDDEMADACNDWIGELDVQEVIDFAEEYNKQTVEKLIEDIPDYQNARGVYLLEKQQLRAKWLPEAHE
jgi:hypothetical protein